MSYIILDHNSILIRYLMALRKDTSNVTGIHRYFWLISKLLVKYPNYTVLIAMDGSKSQNFRLNISKNYKQNRKPLENDIVTNLKNMKKILKNQKFPTYIENHLEADDIAASFAYELNTYANEIIVVSADKDLLQLLTIDNVLIYNPFTRKTWNVSSFIEKYQFHPKYFVLYLAMVGDSSDNIKGIPRVGPKTALKIIQSIREEDLNTFIQNLDLTHWMSILPQTYHKYDFSSLLTQIQLIQLKYVKLELNLHTKKYITQESIKSTLQELDKKNMDQVDDNHIITTPISQDLLNTSKNESEVDDSIWDF